MEHAPSAQNGVGAAHAVGLPHVPAEVHVSTPLPQHCVAPGVHPASPPLSPDPASNPPLLELEPVPLLDPELPPLEPELPPSASTVSVSVSGAGAHTVGVRVLDNAGNISQQYTQPVNINLSAPQ